MMVVQTPAIDLVSLIEQVSPTRLKFAANNRLHGREYCGMCPVEGAGDDRFRVFPNADKPHCFCRRCGWRGDHIDILRHFKGLSFVEALEELGIDEHPQSPPEPTYNRYKSDEEQAAIAERIKLFTVRPCASCGGYDYAFRSDGRLVCPCYFDKVKAWQASKR